MISLAVDIGTTNISVLALDLDTGEVAEHYSISNRRLQSPRGYEYLQDPEEIETAVRTLIGRVSSDYRCLTVTGQMHGILYYDKTGEAVSPLYTWLDGTSSLEYEGEYAADRLSRLTGMRIPVGYGLATRYAHQLFGQVSDDAWGCTGIGEYITGKLIGIPLDRSDATSLAGFGGYDPVARTFSQTAIEEAFGDADARFLKTAEPFSCAGYINDRVFVSYPIGNNQAGFFGLVSSPETSCLVSIGTSGQLSLFSTSSEAPPSMELRPFFDLGYLHVGATLSAGKTYEVLHRFLASVLEYAGVKDFKDSSVYAFMERAARHSDPSSQLHMSPKCIGTRRDPEVRGSITSIDLNNFTLPNLVAAAVDGIIGELYDFRRDLGDLFDDVQKIIAVGSEIRSSRLFRDSLEKQFGIEVVSMKTEDAAASGAALNAGIAAGYITREEKRKLVDLIAEDGAL